MEEVPAVGEQVFQSLADSEGVSAWAYFENHWDLTYPELAKRAGLVPRGAVLCERGVALRAGAWDGFVRALYCREMSRFMPDYWPDNAVGLVGRVAGSIAAYLRVDLEEDLLAPLVKASLHMLGSAWKPQRVNPNGLPEDVLHAIRAIARASEPPAV